MPHPLRPIVLLLLLMFALGGGGAAWAQAERRPNIILIFCDDLGYGDLGVAWQDQRRAAGKPAFDTPNIDTLAEQGVRMPHTYCPAPVCAPSRASLLLGVTQGHANVRDNQFDKALEDNHTLGSVMREAGYSTAAFGKWGLQGKGPSDELPNKFEAHPMNRGFDYFFGYIRHRDGHMHYPKEDKKECYDGAADVSKDLDLCFTPDLFTARCKKWITDQVEQDKDKPFFIYLAFDTPHAILQNPPCPYPAGGGKSGGVQWLGTPGKMINTAKGTYDGYMHGDYAKTDWPDVYKRYANLVRRMDDNVGDLMQLLKDLKIDDNTLVVFTSDNGPSLESYLKDKPFKPDFFEGYGPFDGVKRDLWEGGIRLGMIARWPARIPAGRVSDEPCTFADFMATFCDAAGSAVPARSDGVSILPSMTGRGEQLPANIYVEYFNNGRTPGLAAFEKSHANRKRGQMQAIRIGEYIGVRYDIQSHDDDFEIYNITTDPKQTTNLVGRPSMDELQQQMKDEVLRRRMPNDSAKRPYDDEPVPAVTVLKTTAGVEMRVVERTVAYVVAPAQKTNQVKIDAGLPVSARQTEQDAVMLFTGYIVIPEAGRYTFELTTSGRSLLRLHHATVIDNDRPFQAGQSAQGEVMLDGGLHPFSLYINSVQQADNQIELKWSGPGIHGMQPIPASAYRRPASDE